MVTSHPVFRFLTSMRVALGLLFVFALLTLAGTLISQVPSELKGDPKAYADWLEAVRPRYGGWTGVMETLGLFSVFSSIWFKGTLILLCSSLVACSIRRTPKLWRTARRPRMVMTGAFFERAPLRTEAPIASESGQSATLEALRSAFRSHGYRISTERSGEELHVCADRFRWSPFGRLLAHVSFVLILGGATLTATTGFRDESFAVPVGAKAAVGYGTDLAIEAKRFSDSYYTSGEPRDYMSELVLYDGGEPVREETVRVNHPMRYEGVTVYQSFYGAAVSLRVTDRDGEVLFDEGVPLLYQSEDETKSIGRFQIPGQGLTVFVISPASGEVDRRIGPGQTQVEVYRAGDESPVGFQILSQGEQRRIAGLDFTFTRERQYTGLVVARDRGATLVWIGSTLLVLGICAVFFFPHRRIRAVIRPRGDGTETRVAAIRRRDQAFAGQFNEIVDDVERAVTGAGAS